MEHNPFPTPPSCSSRPRPPTLPPPTPSPEPPTHSPVCPTHCRVSVGVGTLINCQLLRWIPSDRLLPESFRSLRLFELPTQADTGTCSVERPCFLSDHIRPPCTEDRNRDRLKGVLNRACDSVPRRIIKHTHLDEQVGWIMKHTHLDEQVG